MHIGAVIGRGGEGVVHAIPDRADVLAKVYHKPLSSQKAAKLSAMVLGRPDLMTAHAAWPIATLTNRSGGPIVGFIMPKLDPGRFAQVHDLLGPKSRISKFPDTDWRFLVHAASNAARAFQAIHNQGHVVGDVNSNNLLVSKSDALVKLIDCDSFQIMTPGGHVYRCEVGVPEYTPPELQDNSFPDKLRSPNHDAFGLSVLIFQILFMGRHPFAGYVGAGDMPIGRAIKEFRFAYGRRASAYQMQQPPKSAGLNSVPPVIGELFERAFEPGGIAPGHRPKPEEWIKALDSLTRSLRQCTSNSAHYFLTSLSNCPWCQIERGTSLILFGLRSPAATPTTGGVNVSAIWAQIFATSPPAAFPPIPSTHPVTLSPSTEAVLNRKQRRQRAGVGISVAIISVVIAFGLGGIAILLGIGGILIGILIAKTGPSKELHQRLKRELVDAETQWQGIVKQWDDASRGASFLLKRGELETSKIQLEKLPSEELLQLKTLEAARERRQREEYLRTRLIAHATISGIGPARAATLAAYGIRSAADVNVSAILRIPGFGETYALNLASWRQVVERQFILRPPQGADLAAIAALKQEMNLLRARLEQQLCDGPQLLEQIGKQRAAQHAKLLVLAAQALQAKAQAEVNLIGS